MTELVGEISQNNILDCNWLLSTKSYFLNAVDMHQHPDEMPLPVLVKSRISSNIEKSVQPTQERFPGWFEILLFLHEINHGG